MAAKPLTTEAIALTEKKMDMTLDDIIKMSKDNATKKKQRTSNKRRRIFTLSQDKSVKVRQYMDSRSSLRQGVLAQRRSNFQGNRFPLASEAASRAAAAPLRNVPFPRGRTVPWNKRRSGAGMSQQGNTTSVRTIVKPKVKAQVQEQPITKPKTLDSLFANMKEQRMRATVTVRPNYPIRRGGVANGNQRRQQVGRPGRFANDY